VLESTPYGVTESVPLKNQNNISLAKYYAETKADLGRETGIMYIFLSDVPLCGAVQPIFK
jgi:hypothetical protein